MAATDRDALLVLFRLTDGRNWTNNTNWDTDAELSEWYGVNVNDQGRVLKLSLSTNNLRGMAVVPYGRHTFALVRCPRPSPRNR